MMPRDLKKLKSRLKKQKGVAGISATAASSLIYYKALMNYTIDVAAVLEDTVIKTLHNELVQDSTASALALSWEQYRKRVSRLKSKDLAIGVYKKTAKGVDKFQRKKFLSNIQKAVGVDVSVLLSDDDTADVIADGITANIELINTIDDSYKKRATRIIRDGLTSGSNFTSIRKELLTLGGFKDKYAGTEQRRAKLIARDQMQKLTASINKARQEDLGITHYFWETSKDRRVRNSHAKNDGKRFAWNNPPATGHPGDDVACRCVARPDLTPVLGKL